MRNESTTRCHIEKQMISCHSGWQYQASVACMSLHATLRNATGKLGRPRLSGRGRPSPLASPPSVPPLPPIPTTRRFAARGQWIFFDSCVWPPFSHEPKRRQKAPRPAGRRPQRQRAKQLALTTTSEAAIEVKNSLGEMRSLP